MGIQLSRYWSIWGCTLALTLATIAWAQPEPDYPHGDFEADCGTCHGPQGWSPAQIAPSFDHTELSEFELEGSHRKALCRSCHISLDFSAADSDCASCHRDVHNGELGADCSTCHSTTNFIDHAAELRSHRLTRFPLNGAHLAVDCSACHEPQPQGGMRYVNTPVECVACHRQEFQATTAPNHVALGFDEDCTHCHSPMAWETARFDHDASGFPLSGAHAALTCDNCHVEGQFAGTPAQCSSCHQTDYQQAPNHVSGNYSTECQSCHDTTGWQGADFQHDFFPLSGGHAAVECAQCHTSGTFGPIPNTCVDCHQADYTTAPSHAASNFSTTCENCHSNTSWTGASFDHVTYSITGAHVPLSCTQCHTSGTYAPVPSECIDCHQTDYSSAPGHAGSFPTTCENCHSNTSWTGASFDHVTYSITGAHVPLSCTQCHTSGTYAPVPSECIDCHQTDYSSAPGHAGSFPTTCENCHSNTSWSGASFDHTTFPITGAHVPLSCTECHTSGSFGPIPSECVDCHQTDYSSAPGHAGSFPTTCEACHTTTTFAGGTFDHTSFPTTGGHATALCSDCHTSGSYGTIPSDCFSCHQPDYQVAPDHVQLNFPTDCEECHAVTLWINNTFVHSFPTTSPHDRGCTDCHVTGTTAEFSCYGTCHEHSVTEETDSHSDVSGFVYDFQACLNCHPNGRD